MDPHALSIVLPILVILPILYFRMARMLKPQRLKLRSLLIRPVLMIFAAGALIAASPPQFACARRRAISAPSASTRACD